MSEVGETRGAIARAWAWPSLGVAVAYFVVARVSLLLAIPPGFAAPIWPAAGIAVVALLRWPRAWPGVLVGSIAANLVQASGGPATLAAFGIGTGATLQALAGAHLTRRWIGWPNELAAPREILLFFVAIGPAPQLVNAIFGPLCLFATGVVPAAALPLTMSVWWVGDTLGAVACAPLLLAAIGRRRSGFAIAAPTAIVLGVVTLGYLAASRSERAGLERQMDRRVDGLATALEGEVASYVESVHALAQIQGARPGGLPDAELRAVATALRARHPALTAIEWVPRVDADGREAFEADLARRYPGYGPIVERVDGRAVPAAARARHYPVALIHPLEGNESALGFDLASNPDRRRAVERAVRTGEPTLTAPITLVQETGQSRAVLLLAPAGDAGLVAAVLRMDDVVGGVVREREAGARVDLVDAEAERALFGEGSAGEGLPLRAEVRVRAADRTWHLTLSTAVAPVLVTWEPWAVLVAGGLLTWLLAILLMIVTGQTARVARLVDARTAALAASEARVQTIVDHVFDGILSVNDAGRVVAMNPAAVRMFGARVGDPFEDLFTTAPVRTDDERALLELEGYRADGTTFPLELALPVKPAQADAHATATVHDLTERKRVDRLKDEFLSTVSHELRTPLTSIRGALGLVTGMMGATLPPKVLELVGLADRNARRLGALVDDLLDLGRASAGNLELVASPVPVADLLLEAADGVRTYAGEREVSVVIRDEASGEVHVDAQRVVQVLANLLSNALKFSPERARVELVASDRGEDAVRFEVRDRGPGVAPEHRARIFDRFQQADGSDTRAVGGSGLGLAIAREIVRRSGGEIGVSDRDGGGAVFWVELPRDAQRESSPAIESSSSVGR